MRTAHLFAQASSLTLHVLMGLWIVWLASPVWQPVPSGQASDAIDVFVVPAAGPPPLPQLPGLNPIDTSQDDVTIRRPDGSSALSLPGFTYDFSRIARRATLLFPFLTPGLSLDRFVPTPRREIINSFHDSSAPMPVNSRSAGRDKPPLTLSDAALQSVIDECWSRTDRWGGFQRLVKLADTYNPDVGRLSAVLQRYLEQDGLQPYVDTTIRDPRLWVELGQAADHVSFIGFISRYASEHPSTKATIELLFLLDKLAQGSFDALVSLLDVDPIKDLGWTRKVNAGAFNMVAEIRRYYQAQLEPKGLDSADALRGHYNHVRLTILTSILRTTPHGYRASDARFLIGTIQWAQGDAAAALQSWRDMAIDPTDSYVRAYSDILTAIRDSPDGTGQRLDARLVDRVLASEHGRWLSSSIDRLRQFGYHLDTF